MYAEECPHQTVDDMGFLICDKDGEPCAKDCDEQSNIGAEFDEDVNP